MFKVFGWKRLQSKTRNNYFKALMIYKSLNGLAPEYLFYIILLYSTTHGVNTIQAAAGQWHYLRGLMEMTLSVSNHLYV